MEFLLQEDVEVEPVQAPAGVSDVQGFYDGRVILITGGTGFLGKLLIEKLLRDCPGVRKIYLLLRLKSYINIEHRITDFLNLPIFERLHELNPNIRDKIEVIRGDCWLPDLGLGPKDQEKLSAEIEIVFHCASTSMFDSNLKTATDVNVRALKDLIGLSKRMRRLQAFVYVSSIFVQCPHKVIDEAFSRAYISGPAIIEFVGSLNPRLNIPRPIHLGRYPNYYTLTKHIAEDIVKTYGAMLPITILRPGIAISTWKDPIPGWTDNINGPSGLILAIYLGLAKSMVANKSNVAHLVPADMVINAMVVAAWDIAKSKFLNDNTELLNSNEEIPIYNVAGSSALTWGILCTLSIHVASCAFFKNSSKHIQKMPTKFMLWQPWYLTHTSYLLHQILVVFFHYIPGCIMDYITYNIFAKTKYLAYYSKIDLLTNTLTYFTLNSWDVKDANLRALRGKLSLADRQLFDFDTNSIDWNKYFNDYILGIRVHILKDGLESLEESIKSYKKLAIYTFAMLCVLGYVLYCLIRIVV